MKIKNGTNKPHSSALSGPSRNTGVSAGKKTGSARGSQSTTSSSAVNVSSTDQLAARMSGDASQRAERVAQIKLDIESGTYDLDSEKTANKLIDSLTDYSLA